MSEVKPVPTVEERLKSGIYSESDLQLNTTTMSFAKNHALTMERKELRAALEALQAKIEQQAKRIAELEVIEHVSRKLVECKGRYHTEQNMIALAKLFNERKGTE